MRKVFVIGLVGLQGAGKTTLCEWLLGYANLQKFRLAFGDAIKAELEEMGIDTSVKTAYVRRMMQAHGRKRRASNRDYWIERTEELLLEQLGCCDDDGNVLIVIDDVRLLREADWFRRFCITRGYIYQLVRVDAPRELRAERLARDGGQLASEGDETELELLEIAEDETVSALGDPGELVVDAYRILGGLFGCPVV